MSTSNLPPSDPMPSGLGFVPLGSGPFAGLPTLAQQQLDQITAEANTKNALASLAYTQAFNIFASGGYIGMPPVPGNRWMVVLNSDGTANTSITNPAQGTQPVVPPIAFTPPVLVPSAPFTTAAIANPAVSIATLLQELQALSPFAQTFLSMFGVKIT